MAEIFERGARVVTLLGPAGVGKTRLAKRYAASRWQDFPGGAWFVDLLAARALGDVATSVARTLAVSLEGSRDVEASMCRIGQSLVDRGGTLVVVDNCEQIVPDAAAVVARLREDAPLARFLVTSREALGIAGECRYDVSPLGTPGERAPIETSDAVRLFLDRARLVRPAYALTDREAQIVSQIVCALDGIPLAIELAAARMGLMSAAALFERLHRRFELLGTRNRDGPLHQRTLAAAIDWSWSLLEPWEQSALRQCAVFRSGFTLDAAEAIIDVRDTPGAPAVLEIVQRLRDKSLVHAQSSRDDPSKLRLGLYESIREYAALAQSGEDVGAADRHTQYFLREGAICAERIDHGSAEHFNRLAAELDNLRTAHARALGRSPRDALCAAELLVRILKETAPSEALAVANATLSSSGVDAHPEWMGHLVYRRSWIWGSLGDVTAMREDCERLLELAQRSMSSITEAQAYIRLAYVEQFSRKRNPEREAYCRRALDAADRADSPLWRRRALLALGVVHVDHGDIESARDTLTQVVSMADAHGDMENAALARGGLGNIYFERGELDKAERAFEAAATGLLAMGHKARGSAHIYNRANVLQERGDSELAEQCYRELVADLAVAPVIRSLSRAMLGSLLAARDQCDEAGRLLDEAEAGLERTGEGFVAVVTTNRGHLDLALARRALRTGDLEAAEAHRSSAVSRLAQTTVHAEGFDDVRTARRWLERALQPPGVLAVGSGGRWFRLPNSERVEIGRSRVLSSTLAALVRHRRSTPGEPVSVETLQKEVWPGERLAVARSGALRVYALLSRLRALGLRDVLVSRGGGYLLDPLVTIDTETTVPSRC